MMSPCEMSSSSALGRYFSTHGRLSAGVVFLSVVANFVLALDDDDADAAAVAAEFVFSSSTGFISTSESDMAEEEVGVGFAEGLLSVVAHGCVDGWTGCRLSSSVELDAGGRVNRASECE
jgi:hypothetical protein